MIIPLTIKKLKQISDESTDKMRIDGTLIDQVLSFRSILIPLTDLTNRKIDQVRTTGNKIRVFN